MWGFINQKNECWCIISSTRNKAIQSLFSIFYSNHCLYKHDYSQPVRLMVICCHGEGHHGCNFLLFEIFIFGKNSNYHAFYDLHQGLDFLKSIPKRSFLTLSLYCSRGWPTREQEAEIGQKSCFSNSSSVITMWPHQIICDVMRIYSILVTLYLECVSSWCNG